MIFKHPTNGMCVKVLLTATDYETKAPVVIYCEVGYDMEGPLYGDNIMVPLSTFRDMISTWAH